MSSYTLNYFNGRGRAELTRLIFAAAGAKFTDKRIEFADWPALKEKSPLGQMPYLEVDDHKLPQSIAIARFIAREHGLAGSTNLKQVIYLWFALKRNKNIIFSYSKGSSWRNCRHDYRFD